MTELLQTLFSSGVGDTEVWAPLILRLGFGLGLVAHGYPKLFKTFGNFSGYVASLKWPVPKLFAVLAGITEFLGGLFLAAGLLVKPVALIVAIYFVLVILTAHRGQKFQSGWELPYLYLVGMLGLWAMNSSGALSIESVLFGR